VSRRCCISMYSLLHVMQFLIFCSHYFRWYDLVEIKNPNRNTTLSLINPSIQCRYKCCFALGFNRVQGSHMVIWHSKIFSRKFQLITNATLVNILCSVKCTHNREITLYKDWWWLMPQKFPEIFVDYRNILTWPFIGKLLESTAWWYH
jgi:hypothetical protein